MSSEPPIRDADILITENKLPKKEIRSALSRYEATKGVKDYEYDDLTTPTEDKTFLKKHLDKKRFRLLEIQPGLLDNPQVVCEIFEVELDITDGTVVRVSPGADNLPSDEDAAQKLLATSERNSGLTSSQHTASKGSEHADEIQKLRIKEKQRSKHRQQDDENLKYEALSWRWGNENSGEYAIMIQKNKQHYRKRVSRVLGLALKYLRYRTHPRILWIDALCINQSDHKERSIQVAMMDRLYTGASQICVWLGEDDDEGDEGRTAIDFIKNDVSVLREFDKLCRDKKYTDQWKALLVLMQREWFSRRWVVQEIALARQATVFYGPDQIGWRQLATAIGLFVEVESATHRLSELMKTDERFNLIPNWFEHISGLPASLLVNESSRIFRDFKEDEFCSNYNTTTSSQDDLDSGLDEWMLEDSLDGDSSDIDGKSQASQAALYSSMLKGKTEMRHAYGADDSDSADGSYYNYPVTDKMRRSLLTLEHLVTSLAIFDCGRPHDVLYALIAISRDAFPSPPTALTERNKEVLLTEVMEGFVERKPFPLDYDMSYPDVCRAFVEFCIRQRAASDQTTALDILCRPWSKDWSPHDDEGYTQAKDSQKVPYIWKRKPVEVWRTLSDAQQIEYKKRLQERKGLGKPDVSDYNFTYTEWASRADTSEDTFKQWKEKVLDEGDKVISRKHIHKKWARWLPNGRLGSGVDPFEFWRRWKDEDMAGDVMPQESQVKYTKTSLGLPSWVARIGNARFDIFRHPGMDMVKMGRKNADPLVGSLENKAGIYQAAQLTKVDFSSLRFKKREIQPEGLGHYSLYVKGFM